MKKILKYLDFLFVLLLLLNLTYSYKFILVFLNLKTYVFSVFTICVSLIYILYNSKLLKFVFKDRLIFKWVSLVFFLPAGFLFLQLICSIISFDNFIYYLLSFILLPTSLFLGTLLVFVKNPKVSIKRNFILLSILITLVGVLINIFNYDLIRQMMAMDRSKEDIAFVNSEWNRLMGFFDHPNQLAKAIFFISFTFLGELIFKKSILINLSFILISLIGILMTGSRTSLLIYVIMTIIYMIYYVNKDVLFKRINFKITSYLIRVAYLTPFFIIGLILVISILPQILNSIGYLDLFNRFESLFLDSSKIVNEDESFGLRQIVIFQYLDKISESPFLGFGPGLRNEFIEKGIFIVASQNSFLEMSFAYGILYGFFFFYVLWTSFLNVPEIMFNQKTKSIYFFKLLILSWFLYSFSVNYLIIDRTLIIITAFFFSKYILYKRSLNFFEIK